MKYLLLIVLLTGCSEFLPAYGTALNATKAGYIATDGSYARLNAVHAVLCSDAPPAMVDKCAAAKKLLDEADSGLTTGHEAIDVADEIYQALNAEAKK